MTTDGKIDEARMNEQEDKDFNTTKRIMERIFNAYDVNVTFTQSPPYSQIDGTMTATKGDKKRHYTLEIKERNVACLEDLEELPLKVQKYCNVIDHTPKGHTPLVVYLVNGEHYYIFNLNRIDFNRVTLMNWSIPRVQFTAVQQMEKVPTFFLPLWQCVYDGIIL